MLHYKQEMSQMVTQVPFQQGRFRRIVGKILFRQHVVSFSLSCTCELSVITEWL